MTKIINANINHLEDIKRIANDSSFIQANNHMIYYLCCTTFSNYSFVAKKNNEIIGFLFCFNDSSNEYVWIHQVAVVQKEQGGKTNVLLLQELGKKIIRENKIKKVRFATRIDNPKIYKRSIEFTKTSFFGINYKIESLGINRLINYKNEMEVFQITIYGFENKK
jgi:hypothetical protein